LSGEGRPIAWAERGVRIHAWGLRLATALKPAQSSAIRAAWASRVSRAAKRIALSMMAKTSLALFMPRASSASWKIGLSSPTRRSGVPGASVARRRIPWRWACPALRPVSAPATTMTPRRPAWISRAASITQAWEKFPP
jgi:hypothetical protein